jgi:hypothetical protein
VSSTPVGIACGADCSERYVMDTMVTAGFVMRLTRSATCAP